MNNLTESYQLKDLKKLYFQNIDTNWLAFLKEESEKEYFLNLLSFENECHKKQLKIFPPVSDVFCAFRFNPIENTKVVLLGQDPYHGPGQAHGLAFSVPDGVRFPPSLRNIFKELSSDEGCSIPESGNLEKWAKEGVLLLNTVLTVEESKAGSHRNKGWELLTDAVIKMLSDSCNDLVFLLWGNPAQQKAKLIDEDKHLILKTVHPSPLSAYRGFFGCRHFSRTNNYLKQKNRKTVEWCLKD